MTPYQPSTFLRDPRNHHHDELDEAAVLANVAGTQEPIYGPSAIQTVTDQAKDVPYTELRKEHLKWRAMESTNVETQTFYITSDSGHIGLAQVIYSNVAGLRTTCQFNSKIHYPPAQKKPNLWNSNPLSNTRFSPDKYSFHADKCTLTLSEDGSSYTIKSTTSENNVVDLKFSRRAPGFVVGRDGTSYYGTDPGQPWGEMRHAFWPRCRVEGTFLTREGAVDMTGRGLFIHALQGMKPHHAAARWTFIDFQSPTYSAVMMQFTTPPSYGATVVNVGGIATDDALLYAGASNTVSHQRIKQDSEVDWPEPGRVVFEWAGTAGAEAGAPGTEMGMSEVRKAVVEGDIERNDRVDVMAEVPKFVKQIVAGAAGTRPYIYQYIPTLPIKLTTQDGQEHTEEGRIFMEVTFIS
ncbi:MAG: putative cell survival pathways protein [Chrysothrix sp. TS-e1954]|nr:MAG: putative cell survival pathways protein [Chrysothrix sp. TS-e1954]